MSFRHGPKAADGTRLCRLRLSFTPAEWARVNRLAVQWGLSVASAMREAAGLGFTVWDMRDRFCQRIDDANAYGSPALDGRRDRAVDVIMSCDEHRAVQGYAYAWGMKTASAMREAVLLFLDAFENGAEGGIVAADLSRLRSSGGL